LGTDFYTVAKVTKYEGREEVHDREAETKNIWHDLIKRAYPVRRKK